MKQTKKNKLEKQLKLERLKEIDKLIIRLKAANKKGIKTEINPDLLIHLKKDGELSLWQDRAMSFYKSLREYGIDCTIEPIFREIDPYSYWPGDELSGYKLIKLI